MVGLSCYSARLIGANNSIVFIQKKNRKIELNSSSKTDTKKNLATGNICEYNRVHN
jgi:hypothetical protein